MKKGERIDFPEVAMPLWGSICISRRSMKHIVEQRSIHDGFDKSQIKELIKKSCTALANPEIIMEDTNEKYPHGWLFGRFDSEMNVGVIAIVDFADKNKQYLITVFYKEAKKFYKLFTKI